MRHGTLRSDFIPKPAKFSSRNALNRTRPNISRNRGKFIARGRGRGNRIRVTVANNLSRIRRGNDARNSLRREPSSRYQFQEYLDSLKREEELKSANDATEGNSNHISHASSSVVGNDLGTESSIKSEAKQQEAMEIQDKQSEVIEEISDLGERRIELVKTQIPVNSKLKHASLSIYNTRTQRRKRPASVKTTLKQSTSHHENFQPSARLFWNSVL